MSLTKEEFNVIKDITLCDNITDNTTNESLKKHGLSFKEMEAKGLLDEKGITQKGKDELENYTVKRAIFMAAGFGSRLKPITINTPKPLVRVNGKRIIDGLIDACLENGIEEIYIVTGYLGEQFEQLLHKYPMIKFINNKIFNEANNISSALCMKDLLENAYVFEADLLISNPKIIEKYHYTSDFLAIKKDETDDWCFEVTDGYITEEKVGGKDCWQMVGISYWDKEAGKKLSQDLKSAFDMPKGKDLYWEQVPLVVFKDKYKVGILECKDEDIVEIDTFEELKALDKSYCV